MLSLISNIPNYDAVGERISIADFTTFLHTTQEVNAAVDTATHLLSEVRAMRSDAYHGEIGLKQRCAAIRDTIGALPKGRSYNRIKMYNVSVKN